MNILSTKKLDSENYKPEINGEPLTGHFVIKPLTARFAAKLKLYMATGNQEGALDLCLNYGLTGWAGFIDEAGNPIPYNQSNKQNLDPDLQVLCANRVTELTLFTDEEIKNL